MKYFSINSFITTRLYSANDFPYEKDYPEKK